MLEKIISEIQEVQGGILGKAQAAKLFLELSDPKRIERAAEILKGDRIQILEESLEQVFGVCAPADEKQEAYRVSFKIRNSRIRGASCNCMDSGNVNCKHVLALSMKWFMNLMQEWKKLGEAIAILQSPLLQKK